MRGIPSSRLRKMETTRIDVLANLSAFSRICSISTRLVVAPLLWILSNNRQHFYAARREPAVKNGKIGIQQDGSRTSRKRGKRKSCPDEGLPCVSSRVRLSRFWRFFPYSYADRLNTSRAATRAPYCPPFMNASFIGGSNETRFAEARVIILSPSFSLRTFFSSCERFSREIEKRSSRVEEIYLPARSHGTRSLN